MVILVFNSFSTSGKSYDVSLHSQFLLLDTTKSVNAYDFVFVIAFVLLLCRPIFIEFLGLNILFLSSRVKMTIF